ncbi:probable glucan endo-1,3-beta-glucosidase BG4 [Typha angustifolia]|uniref:probable glucan endo-1,3-beta-glucosidase BG4 n=1 Tax=Typha angustifolia TaxID=59011 RepID=UPI003C308C64
MSYSVLLLACVLAHHAIFAASTPPTSVGVCYGTLGDNLPLSSDVISLLERCGIYKFRLYNPNLNVLDTLLRQSDRMVSVGVPNEHLSILASSLDEARNWVAKFYTPYRRLNIENIVVGNEVVPGENAQYLVGATRNLYTAFREATFPDMILTTALSSGSLVNTYPPSQATFSPEAIGVMTDYVNLLKELDMYYNMIYIHVYPYFAYAADPANVRLDYALFQATEPVFHDGDLAYFNLFDAIYDSFMWAMEKINGQDIYLAVGESGWPSAGNGNFTTPQLAQTYMTNLYQHIVVDNKTPKNSKGMRGVMAFALFNENLKPPGVEQNFGLFYPDLHAVYPTPFCQCKC